MPRQRKGKPDGSSKEEVTKQDDGEPAAATLGESDDTGSRQQGRREKGGVSWSPVFKRIGVFFLVISIPALVNYAALNQEARMLVPTGRYICTMVAIHAMLVGMQHVSHTAPLII
jgi:hypothetical protein